MNTDSVAIVKSTVAVDAGMDVTICPGDSIDLSAVAIGTGLSYQWSPDTSLTTATIAGPIAFPDTTTKYFVTVTEANGCTVVDSVTVTVYPKRDAAIFIFAPSPFVAPAKGILNVFLDGGAGDISTVMWTGPFLDDSLSLTPAICPGDSSGQVQYSVVVTDNNNCIFRDSSDVFTIMAPMLPPPMAAIAGTITTEKGEMVERTTITLGDYEMAPEITGATGNYQFDSIPMHGNYQVIPEKDINPLNGVSTFDLVLMSKHILGAQLLDSPYKMIAADVNRSGTITAFDMVQLRQLILNVTCLLYTSPSPRDRG